MSDTKQEPFRVFIAYSHADKDLATTLYGALKSRGLKAMMDEYIHPGMPFTDAIKSMIATAHAFIPLLTENSRERPWVHQETGYAIALGIPVVPVARKEAVPEELTAQLRAVVFQDKSDLVQRIEEVDFNRLVNPVLRPPPGNYAEAYWPEERTRLLAEYANLVYRTDNAQPLRQCGALSSFCIPRNEIKEPVWLDREGGTPRTPYYHYLQREERLALELHARGAGCRLIIYPEIEFKDLASTARRVRLTTLLEFLEDPSLPDDKLEVAISRKALEGSLTIVGDWFSAESLLPGRGGYRQTLFKWHAPTVHQRVQLFDRQFGELRQLERRELIEYVKKIIAAIPDEGPDG